MKRFRPIESPFARRVAWVPIMLLLFLGISCAAWLPDSSNPPAPTTTIATITPGWTLPAPPNATLGQSFNASVVSVSGYTYAWTVTSGGATLVNPTAATVTFTPTAVGSLTLQCAVTDTTQTTVRGTYAVQVGTGAVLNPEPATISLGQGTILLATFTGTTGVVNPGALAVTSGVGIVVTPTATTSYTLTVDGVEVAMTTVNVMAFVPKFVYVGNNGSSISAFTLDGTSGALSPVAGSPFNSISADQVVASADGRFLYAAGQTHGVYAFNIDGTTGALTALAGSPFATDPGGLASVYNIALDPLGRFLYTSGSDGKVYAFTSDPDSGVLTAVTGSPYAAGSNDRGGVLVHPSGKYVYAVASNDKTVYAFTVDQSSGALAAVSGSPFDASGGGLVVDPYGVAVDPTGAYFFTKGEEGTADNQYMAGFSVNITTGALTTLSSSPFGPLPGRDAYHGLCFHPTLDVLYTAFYGSSTADAGAFTLNLGAGTLTAMAGSPYSLFSTHGSDNITVDRSGQFAFSTDWSEAVIGQMRVTDTGLLTTLSGAALAGANEDVTAVGTTPASISVAGVLQAITTPQ